MENEETNEKSVIVLSRERTLKIEYTSVRTFFVGSEKSVSMLERGAMIQRETPGGAINTVNSIKQVGDLKSAMKPMEDNDTPVQPQPGVKSGSRNGGSPWRSQGRLETCEKSQPCFA